MAIDPRASQAIESLAVTLLGGSRQVLSRTGIVRFAHPLSSPWPDTPRAIRTFVDKRNQVVKAIRRIGSLSS
jgi:hypothetical protein